MVRKDVGDRLFGFHVSAQRTESYRPTGVDKDKTKSESGAVSFLRRGVIPLKGKQGELESPGSGLIF